MSTDPSPTSRLTTVVITREEAAVLLDRLPVWLALPILTAHEHDTLNALHAHLVKFFLEELHY